MAPEIWRGEPGTRRADIYSMGALLYEAAPWRAALADVQLSDLAKVVNEQDALPCSPSRPPWMLGWRPSWTAASGATRAPVRLRG